MEKMQENAGNRMEFLTSAEAAEYLRIKERKLYELVANGAVPCSKVTGKWLFPRHELDRWVLAGLHRPAGLPDAEPMPIVGGSHDPLLEWALRDSGSGLATLAEGSEAGLERVAQRDVVAAAIHLHRLDDSEADANVAALAADTRLLDAVLIGFVEREQGLLVPPGNPAGITSLADVARGKRPMAQRPKGAGAQLLFLAWLRREGLTLDDIVTAPRVCPTGPDVAQAVRAGDAACGIATRAVADTSGLGFVPLMWERFDLVVRQRDLVRPPFQALLECMRGEAFARRARDFGGYRLDITGRVRFAR